MKRILLSALGLLALGTAALAQVNTVPQVGQITSILRNATYGAYSVGLVPAASATDIFCINASASRDISVREVMLSGTAGTAITTPVLLYRRASQDTGGAPATSLALPVPVPMISSDPASTATLTAYTANPTVVDASPVLLQAPAISFSVTTGTNTPSFFYGGTNVDLLSKGFNLLKGSTQQLCLNLNGVSITSGVLAVGMKWVEN